ncbi:hypothetical protein H2198_004308 [Neophaeococcomyces mojaviensis]|uniref:Uncharacterized protein n=1 Tax=Neophaeococcomyces mojaviensis TaxID=3383035 RepID=A0ACC3A8Y0_9EURO|nr:hypothetical protein H2198_004308 [Knufia sp. JES_112]
MFEVPNAKRLKRSELLEDNSNERVSLTAKSQEIEIEALVGTSEGEEEVPNYGFEYDFIDRATSEAQPVLEQEPEPAEETFQFNLFLAPADRPAPTATASSATETEPKSGPALISIRSPSPAPLNDISASNFAQQRPDSYYLTSSLPVSTQQRLQESYTSSAVSADTILALSRKAWPGTSLPWRVINLPCNPRQIIVHKVRHQPGSNTSDIQQPRVTTTDINNKINRRPRPSKKRRLMIRAKVQKRRALIDESKTKEEHEKEKKNKKNRDRKVKRRAKERREKEESRKAGDTGEKLAEGGGALASKDSSAS